MRQSGMSAPASFNLSSLPDNLYHMKTWSSKEFWLVNRIGHNLSTTSPNCHAPKNVYAFLACDLKSEIMQCNCALFEKLNTVPTLHARKEAFITSAIDHFVATNLTGASKRIRFMFAYWVWMWATSSLPVTQYQIWKILEPSLKSQNCQTPFRRAVESI